MGLIICRFLFNCQCHTRKSHEVLKIHYYWLKMYIEEKMTVKCSLHPIPSCILKGTRLHLCETKPAISTIINTSFASESVPSSLKTAKGTPCLRNPLLEKNNLNHYRPISNLFKVSERVACCQLHYTKNEMKYRQWQRTILDPFKNIFLLNDLFP